MNQEEIVAKIDEIIKDCESLIDDLTQLRMRIRVEDLSKEQVAAIVGHWTQAYSIQSEFGELEVSVLEDNAE